MTNDLLEDRLRNLAIEVPDAGRVSARVLDRNSSLRRFHAPRLVTVPIALAALAVLVVYFAPAADLAVANRVPWSGEMLRWAGLVGARDRITVVNTSATSAGYRVTLEGAYADSTRTVLLIHTEPAAMPDGFTTIITDQFARTYRWEGGSFNLLTGDMSMQFESLAWPDSITGARITLHLAGVQQPPSVQTTHGTWELTAALGVDQGQSLPVPASGDLGPVHFRFKSVVYTPATLAVDVEITGASQVELGRMIPGLGGKAGPALQIHILDPSGQIIDGSGDSSGDQRVSDYRFFGFRTGDGGKYVVRVSYYGYGSFDRVIDIPS